MKGKVLGQMGATTVTKMQLDGAAGRKAAIQD